jgi:hypothetical protein
MARYVLYYSPGGDPPRRDVRLIQGDPSTSVIAAREDLVLVDSDQVSIDRFLAMHPRWQVSTGSAIDFPIESGATRARRRR